MIRLKPTIDFSQKCPPCGAALVADEFLITGMHSMARLACPKCSTTVYGELPVNAGLFYPGMIDAGTGRRCDDMPFDNWYLRGLVDAYRNRKADRVPLEVVRNRELGDRPVLLLNSIDSTYGHALFELFNTSYYLAKKKQFDLVILCQRNLRWLAPDGAAQLWVADIGFSQAVNWFDDLARQVQGLLLPLKDVYLCRSFVQADSSDFRIEDYARIKPFPLEEWNARLVKPTVTFIWRHDRFWRRVVPRVFDNRLTRRLFPALIRHVAHRRQFRWLLDFADALRAAVPAVDFAIAGMDERSPALPAWIKDFRFPSHEDDTARRQLERYAQSHLIIGCNGSSLILPSCLAGSAVDIVPGDQWAVSPGSFAFRITSIGDTQFRYTLLPPEVTVERAVGVVVSMLRDRAYVEIQTSPPWRDHESGLDWRAWSAYRREAFELQRHFTTTAGLVTLPRDS